MNKNIIFKVKSFPEVSETFVVSNIIETIKAGHTVSIIADRIQSIKNTSQLDLFEKYRLLKKTTSFSNQNPKTSRKVKALIILLHPLKLYCFLKFWRLRQKKSLLDCIFLIQFYWEYRNAKVFHVHFATAINPLFELKKIGLLKSKIIVTFHGYDAHFLPEGAKLETLLLDFKNYTCTITVNSNYLRDKLISQGFIKETIEIIPIGYDEVVFNSETRKSFSITPFKLITIGRLVKLKGHHYGIKALKLLVDKGYNVQYTLIGAGVEFENLQGLIEELELGEHVQLVGVKSQVEVKELLEQHQVFLMTSTIDEHKRREAFGVVSLEAQAMGLPIVGFDSGGFPDTVVDGETGFLVKDKDYIELTKKIEILMSNKKLLEQMSKNAQAHVGVNFNVENTTGRYFELYNTL